MVKPEIHIVHKVLVDVHTSSMEKGKNLEQNLNEFLVKEVFPLIENTFSQYQQYAQGDSIQIDKLYLEFSMDDLSQLPKLISEAIHNKLQPVETLMEFSGEQSKFSRTNREAHIHSDPTTSSEELATELSLGEGVLKTINGKSPSEVTEVTRMNKEQKAFESWKFFMENGKLPWWIIDDPKDLFSDINLLNQWLSTGKFKEKTLSMMGSPIVQSRMIMQYNDLSWFPLILSISPRFQIGEAMKKEIYNTLRSISRQEGSFLSGILLYVLFTENKKNYLAPPILKRTINQQVKVSSSILVKVRDWISKMGEGAKEEFEQLRRHIPEVFKEEGFPEGVKPVTNHSLKLDVENRFSQLPGNEEKVHHNDKPGDMPGKEGIWVGHAGLILLHPFLPAFFKDCGVLDKRGLLTDPVLAAHLLYYVATKNDNPFEYQLQFEKFLCGIPVNEPIIRELAIDGQQKVKCDQLLASLIHHWKKLKNTGPETVRHEFLQRNGKISFEKEMVRINIERKPQDILMEGLSWNMSIVKLPWKKGIVYVEW